MGDLLQLRGSLQAAPPEGAFGLPSGDLLQLGELDERLLLRGRQTSVLTLSSDAAFSVPVLGGAGGPFVSGAHFLMLRTSSKVRARLTSSDGATQAVPVDGLLVLMSTTVPITLLDLTRLTGVVTTVRLFMAERL